MRQGCILRIFKPASKFKYEQSLEHVAMNSPSNDAVTAPFQSMMVKFRANTLIFEESHWKSCFVSKVDSKYKSPEKLFSRIQIFQELPTFRFDSALFRLCKSSFVPQCQSHHEFSFAAAKIHIIFEGNVKAMAFAKFQN